LLEIAEGPLQPLIAIGGLGGLRTAELLRLEWEDVWRVAGHIEISQTKSKTRSRRLVTICPALEEWLRCHRSLQNQPVRVESKPATLRCLIHIMFFDPGKGFLNFFMSVGSVHCTSG
jgi:integrase